MIPPFSPQVMQGKWSQLIIKLTVWLLIELLLNVVGLDTLADYSEYVFIKEQSVTLYKQYPVGV